MIKLQKLEPKKSLEPLFLVNLTAMETKKVIKYLIVCFKSQKITELKTENKVLIVKFFYDINRSRIRITDMKTRCLFKEINKEEMKRMLRYNKKKGKMLEFSKVFSNQILTKTLIRELLND